MRVYDSILNAAQLAALVDYPKNWKSDWVAKVGSHEVYKNSSIRDFGAANRRVVSVPAELAQVVERLKDAPQDQLVRAYFNSMDRGTEPERHRDSNLCYGHDYTVVVYITPDWRPEYGGETLAFDDVGQILGATCQYGRVVKFRSCAIHQAKPVSKSCGLTRTVAVFKFTKFSQAEQVMLNRGWDSVSHKMGYTNTFLEHLLETANILNAKGASREVVAAGAFHAAMGTHFFTPPNPMTLREVSDTIGAVAAALVYQFATRERSWIKGHGSDALKLIAAANEYDLATVRKLPNA
jgi:hypothetical protein